MVLPYATAQASIELLTTVLFGTLIQSTLIYVVVTFFGIIFSSKECIIPSIISGLVVGLILKLLDQFIFKHHANILLNSLPDVDILYRIYSSQYPKYMYY